ncbi:phosphatase -like protein [Hapsidospora chrysogenum ATCC 11550]|uniref:Phosphatase-like protein n=1 Tax=Hapsidospora chrysogenum (strain ATCC 11550 / CBS 779.69 / DSM 880 / IAM 14645 / JCM 23072 / IMI 49137) TaxID=857340 RepID=A0A086SYI2_HAPC1|nr:phosphatase -like protein [Hapsidospora chrysogenum ATCC 11550]
MRLFLVRHGETVDNAANVYAGTRDSALSMHGVVQAQRLASHLASSRHCSGDTQIFSSTLQRAAKTAEAIRDACGAGSVRQLAQLRERDFGSLEGTKIGAVAHEYAQDAESAQSMRDRVDDFLDHHLLPLVMLLAAGDVVIVAHGIILGVMFRQLSARLPAGSTIVSPEAQPLTSSNPSPRKTIPVLPVWRNTGYLEATLSPATAAATAAAEAQSKSWSALQLRIIRVNCVEHLQGLRKTRGGIGSTRFDEKQKTLDAFYTSKERKAAADAVE